MERFSQFRDKGSGISPFLPIHTPLSLPTRFLHLCVFAVRLPFFLAYAVLYFVFLVHVPVPALRKLFLWVFMLIPGLCPRPLPHPGSVVAANFTSPVDPLYLAAVFDPIFVIAYPGSRAVRHVSLFHAVLHALSPIRFDPPSPPPPSSAAPTSPPSSRPTPIALLPSFPSARQPTARASCPRAPVSSTSSRTHIFPVSIRYTPADVTTPVPGRWISFLWNLLSQTTICIRVRIAESIHNDSPEIALVPL
ncbi:unnamed protein product [Parascedosporium putredinis]|uniref:Uncharacterized protein n=1 Tax=Parascedosporium putredinis TaxID=1442378 RepID=A0A9P1GZ17_9PEZI|nr:unnamed protein product [Parascedosporium putredinis]CAI7991302.1 unnamed protein product [Parascedosporium putredinis]